MAPADRRTTEQIREEIRTERAELDTALAALRADANRLARVSGSALAALASLLVLIRLRGRRRAR
jgi:ABC-type transporter Mla MlaB component